MPSLLLDVAPQYLAVDDAESADRLPMGGMGRLLKYGVLVS
jgi:hypothetical protein